MGIMVKCPFVLRKTFVNGLQDRERYYKQIIEKLEGTADERAAEAYKSARAELKSVLRELLVDTNYEIFKTPDNLLRGRTQAFFSTALAYFHERSEK